MSQLVRQDFYGFRNTQVVEQSNIIYGANLTRKRYAPDNAVFMFHSKSERNCLISSKDECIATSFELGESIY